MRSRIFFRYLAFALEIILLAVLQSTPGFFPELFGSKPLLLLSAALSFAAAEEVIPSVILGAVCGAFADVAAFGGVGYFAAASALVCFGLSSVIGVYLNKNILTFSLLSAAGCIAVIGGYFLLFRLFAGVPDSGGLFATRYISRIIYTFILSLPLYFLNVFLRRKLF